MLFLKARGEMTLPCAGPLSPLTFRKRMDTVLRIKRGVASGTFRPVLRQYGGFATRTRELRR